MTRIFYLLLVCLVTFEISRAKNCDELIESDMNQDIQCSVVRLYSLLQSPILNFVGRTNLKVLDLTYSNPSCPTNKPKDLSFLKHFPNLNILRLHGNFADIESNFEDNLNLTQLEISSVEIENLRSETFSNLRELKILRMRGNRLQELVSKIFAQNIKLEYLQISSNKLSDLSEQLFLANIKLREIDMSDNKIKKLPSKIFSSLTDLERILIADNLIEDLPDSLFSKSTKLKSVDLHYNKIKFVSKKQFEGLLELQSVDMRHNKIRTLDTIFSTNSKLRRVSFGGNLITKVSPEIFHKYVSMEQRGCWILDNPCCSNFCEIEECVKNWNDSKVKFDGGEF